MNALILSYEGMEDVCAEEVRKIIPAQNIRIEKGKLFFSCKSIQELADVCYHGRTFSRVVLLLEEGTVDDMPLPRVLSDVKEYMGKTAVVLCERDGDHTFTSFQVEQKLNRFLIETYGVAIDHKHAETIFFLKIENERYYFGIDLAGIDLGRRDYRIFLGAEALKGTLAAGLLYIAQYDSKHALLDPFCRQGIIPIEAALYATNSSPHKYGKEKFAFARMPNLNCKLVDKETDFKGTIIAMDDNFKQVSSAKKNAKIAGVTKSIEFSRTNLDWLDAKFGKNFLDRIITYPIQQGKMVSEEICSKIYHEFFYQAEFILKKSGTVCVCMKRGVELIKKKAEEFKFQLEHERKIKVGAEELTVLVFSKNSA